DFAALLEVHRNAHRVVRVVALAGERLEGAARHPTGALGAGAVVDLDLLDGPVAQADAVQPLLEEAVPLAVGVAGVRLQLALEVGHAEDAVAVLLEDVAHEAAEAVLVQPLLDDADDAGALVVAHAEQVGEVAELGDLLHDGAVLAAADGAEEAVGAVV